MKKKLKIALILGMHPFDAINMYAMFWQMESIQLYPQLIENYLCDFGHNNNEYDGFVFYNMNIDLPASNTNSGDSPAAPKDPFLGIGEDGKGIVVLHHALLAYPFSEQWDDLVGIGNRGSFGYFPGTNVDVQVADSTHPITKGMPEWSVIDETYLMDSADKTCHVLLETPCEKSMRTIAWTKKCRNSNVFCFALGHDAVPFGNPCFKELLERGILWSCGQL